MLILPLLLLLLTLLIIDPIIQHNIPINLPHQTLQLRCWWLFIGHRLSFIFLCFFTLHSTLLVTPIPPIPPYRILLLGLLDPIIANLNLVTLLAIDLPPLTMELLHIDRQLPVLVVLVLDLLFRQDVCLQVDFVIPWLEELRVFEPHMMCQRTLWTVALVALRHGAVVVPFDLRSIATTAADVIVIGFHFLHVTRKVPLFGWIGPPDCFATVKYTPTRHSEFGSVGTIARTRCSTATKRLIS